MVQDLQSESTKYSMELRKKYPQYRRRNSVSGAAEERAMDRDESWIFI